MSSKVNILLTLFITLVLTTQCNAKPAQASTAARQISSALEFYTNAIANPQQILILSTDIRGLLANKSTRYEELNNNLAKKMNWFDTGPFGLEYIELKSEPSKAHPHGYYSITLKQIDLKKCEALSNHRALNENFVRVELNGSPVFLKGLPQQPVATCKSQWFMQDGKNELKYIGY